MQGNHAASTEHGRTLLAILHASQQHEGSRY